MKKQFMHMSFTVSGERIVGGGEWGRTQGNQRASKNRRNLGSTIEFIVDQVCTDFPIFVSFAWSSWWRWWRRRPS